MLLYILVQRTVSVIEEITGESAPGSQNDFRGEKGMLPMGVFHTLHFAHRGLSNILSNVFLSLFNVVTQLLTI